MRKGTKHSPETRTLISRQIKRAYENGWGDWNHSDETKQKISKGVKEWWDNRRSV